MTDIVYVQQKNKINFHWVPEIIVHPRKVFQQIAAHPNSVWLTPLLILSVVALIQIGVAGSLKTQAAMMGEITYPPDFQYYTPEQQAQYMQAIQSTQGPVFIYVLPAISSLLGVWFGWLFLGGMLHLTTTLLGGRGSTASSMNIVAWSSIPLVIRKLVQVFFMLFTKKMINNPGLSGFTLTGDSGGSTFLYIVLGLIDIYFIWQIVLLIIGVRADTSLSKGKSTFGVLISVFLIFFIQVGLAYLMSRLGELEITRPFFF